MGSFDYGSGAAISKYTQTAVLQTSQTISVPPGTKRIEALLCGGGGGGTASGGGGFGGCQIYSIPITGAPLSVVIGAGGAANNPGGTTTVSASGTVYAAVGGGGSGQSVALGPKYGGSGGIGGGGGTGSGAPPFSPNYLWSAMDVATRSGVVPNVSRTFGYGGSTAGGAGVDGYLGYGGGGGYYDGTSSGGPGATGGGGATCGSGGTSAGAGGAGGGGGASANGVAAAVGGSMASVAIWGLTGFAGGSGAGVTVNYGGGGGGGMLAVGSNGVTKRAEQAETEVGVAAAEAFLPEQAATASQCSASIPEGHTL